MDEYNALPNPLGHWSYLKPSFSRQVLSLFKKQFIIKFRNPASLIEIIVAFVLIIICTPSYYCTDTVIQNERFPKQEKLNNQSLIDWFSQSQSKVVVVCMPDIPLMYYLIGNTTLLKTVIYGGQLSNISFPSTKFSYVNTTSKLKSEMFLTRYNAVSFQWLNINDKKKYLTEPHIKVNIQSTTGNPTIDLYLQLRNSIIKMRYLIENKGMNISDIYQTSLSLNTSISVSPFPHPKVINRTTIYSFSYGILAAIAIVIATIPDMEAIFEEKQNRVLAFSFLMGMKETAFWVTNFTVSFVICFFIYLFISLVLAFWFGMNGNSFGMIFVFSIIYIIAELWFQYFVSTFINNVKNGRGFTVGLIMASVATCLVFQFSILTNKSDASYVIIYIFSFFPMAAYELFIMQGSIASYTDISVYHWNNMNNSDYVCPPWIPLVWLLMDAALYFLLFLALNAFLPRKYGQQPYKFMHFLKCKPIKKTKDEKTDSEEDEENRNKKENAVINVDNLSKKYKGMKDMKALDNVSFKVNKGEMIVVIGPNGSGKSTLIDCLSRIIKPTEGKISILGHRRPHSLGVCCQENVIIKKMSVREHFELFGAYRGVPPDVLENTIDFLGSTLNLLHSMDNKAGNLSGGQKRKLCIGLSLLGNPKIVLMDEPTAGVDVQGRMLIWKMLSSLKGTTSIITSHELEEAETLSSRLFIVTDGKLTFAGSSTELRKQSKCGYVLRIDSTSGNAESVLKLAQAFIPEAEISEDRENVIRMPSSRRISEFLLAFAEQKNKLGVKSYTFSVEQLEDVLSNLVYNI